MCTPRRSACWHRGRGSPARRWPEGAGEVLIIERDSALGGILQQCIHPGFGLTYYNEELTGPEYAARFIEKAEEMAIPHCVSTTVVDLARQGDSLSLEDLAREGKRVLRFGGRLCVCLRPARLLEAMELFQAYQLEPKRLRLCQQRPGKAPFLFLLECRRGGRPGLTVEPVLLLEGEDGAPSREIEAIYGDYRDNPEHQKR